MLLDDPSESVATVLTVYGIETFSDSNTMTIIICVAVATVLTVYGIETEKIKLVTVLTYGTVATVLTVYGIETRTKSYHQYMCY